MVGVGSGRGPAGRRQRRALARRPREAPLTYPGTAPAGSYLLVGDRVAPVSLAADGATSARLADGRAVDEVLAALDVAPFAERTPVVAYGANRSPRTLVLKMDHHDGGDGTVAVPVVAARLVDLDVVVGGFSSQGYLYADLAPSPGTVVVVAVTMLDDDQLAAVHRSEGVGAGGYEVVALPDVVLDGGARTEALAYAGPRPVVASPATGTPLAFSAIPAEGRRLPAQDQQTLLAHVLEATGVLAEVAALVDAGAGSTATDVAQALAGACNGAWWAARRGGRPAPAAAAARAVVTGALDRHRPGRSAAELLLG